MQMKAIITFFFICFFCCCCLTWIKEEKDKVIEFANNKKCRVTLLSNLLTADYLCRLRRRGSGSGGGSVRIIIHAFRLKRDGTRELWYHLHANWRASIEASGSLKREHYSRREDYYYVSVAIVSTLLQSIFCSEKTAWACCGLAAF